MSHNYGNYYNTQQLPPPPFQSFYQQPQLPLPVQTHVYQVVQPMPTQVVYSMPQPLPTFPTPFYQIPQPQLPSYPTYTLPSASLNDSNPQNASSQVGDEITEKLKKMRERLTRDISESQPAQSNSSHDVLLQSMRNELTQVPNHSLYYAKPLNNTPLTTNDMLEWVGEQCKNAIQVMSVEGNEVPIGAFYIEANRLEELCDMLIGNLKDLPLSDQMRKCQMFIYTQLTTGHGDRTYLFSAFRKSIINAVAKEQSKRVQEYFNRCNKLPELKSIEDDLCLFANEEYNREYILSAFYKQVASCEPLQSALTKCRESLNQPTSEWSFGNFKKIINAAMQEIHLTDDSWIRNSFETTIRNEIADKILIGDIKAFANQYYTESGTIDKLEFVGALEKLSLFCTKNGTLPCTLKIPTMKGFPICFSIQGHALIQIFDLKNTNFTQLTANIQQQLHKESANNGSISSLVSNLLTLGGISSQQRLQNQLATIRWAEELANESAEHLKKMREQLNTNVGPKGL